MPKKTTAAWEFVMRVLILFLGIFLVTGANQHVRTVVNRQPSRGWESRIEPWPSHGQKWGPTVVVTRLPSVSSSPEISRMVSLIEKELSMEGFDEAYDRAARIIDIATGEKTKMTLGRFLKLKTDDDEYYDFVKGLKQPNPIIEGRGQESSLIEASKEKAARFRNEHTKITKDLEAFHKFHAARAARVHTGKLGIPLTLNFPNMALYGTLTDDGNAPLFPIVSDVTDRRRVDTVAQLAVMAHTMGKAMVRDTLRGMGPQAATWMEQRLRSVPIFVLDEKLFSVVRDQYIDENPTASPSDSAYMRYRADTDFGLGTVPADHIIIRAGRNMSLRRAFRHMTHSIIHGMWTSWEHIGEKPGRVEILKRMIDTEDQAASVLRDAYDRIPSSGKRPKALNAMKDTWGRHHEMAPEAIAARAGAGLHSSLENNNRTRHARDLLGHHVGKHFEDHWAPHLTATIRAFAMAMDQGDFENKKGRNEKGRNEKENKTNNGSSSAELTIVDRAPNVLEFSMAKEEGQGTLLRYLEKYLTKAVASLKASRNEFSKAEMRALADAPISHI
jgi:hypothetical protein